MGKQLWKGADGSAGEIGHFVVEPEGRPCRCGSRGCLEQYASATGIVNTVRALAGQGQKTSLEKMIGGELSSIMVSEAARMGDRVALAAFREAGMEITYRGNGAEEVGLLAGLNKEATSERVSPIEGSPLIRIDPRYFRPTEVDFLLGDASKARQILGWTP